MIPNRNDKLSDLNWGWELQRVTLKQRKMRVKRWAQQCSRSQVACEYPVEFNDDFKERIREKFNYKCFLCGMSEIENGRKLIVHHIDYNKKNMDEDNFITCCRWCHGVTNGNRDFWERAIRKELNS